LVLRLHGRVIQGEERIALETWVRRLIEVEVEERVDAVVHVITTDLVRFADPEDEDA
jgi:hypothetical protein